MFYLCPFSHCAFTANLIYFDSQKCKFYMCQNSNCIQSALLTAIICKHCKNCTYCIHFEIQKHRLNKVRILTQVKLALLRVKILTVQITFDKLYKQLCFNCHRCRGGGNHLNVGVQFIKEIQNLWKNLVFN